MCRLEEFPLSEVPDPIYFKNRFSICHNNNVICKNNGMHILKQYSTYEIQT